MNEKCLGWNEIPVKISASNTETASFATDVVNTYNELIHYLYFNLRDDVFLKKMKDGFYREIFIMDIINLMLQEWFESPEEMKIKNILVPEIKTILSSYHELLIKCFNGDGYVLYYKRIEISANKQTVI
ncbi:hypothetical protein SB6412_00424 [Klebsiella pasteurii]|uniref:hypothetical protein n=1 Tax=Klebsiella pasteurii TaxID=2587529 RepID=UPI00115AB4C8|nr:hypothetical protein [Klebsiella pasteurii]VUS28181.1 hypothetical protein SB6412_00424 [Klebsiella pasteurii]